MPYFVGLDEAGYGPNLGPLVQTAVACWAPDTHCLWERLADTVCRSHDVAVGRMVIDDSKKVYSGRNGLERLEGALAILSAAQRPTVAKLIASVAEEPSAVDLAAEAWFACTQALPAFLPPKALQEMAENLQQNGAAQQVQWRAVRCLITPAPRFNSLVAEFDSKGALLIRGVATLLRSVLAALPPDDDVICTIDKQGGRNYYAAMIQSAFPASWVHAEAESAAESRYRVTGQQRSVSLRIIPRAESASMPVALASMLSKYLRELLMHQFNRFWRDRLPGLEPTAGYPVDAARFMAAIRPLLPELGIVETAVWRAK